MSCRTRSRVTVQVRIGLVLVLFTAAAARAESRATETRGVITASIDAADAYLPSNEGSYWVVSSPEVEIPIVLDAPAPGGDGFGVNTVSSLTPGLGTVIFPPGTTARTAARVFGDEAPVFFYPGWIARWGYFSLTSAGPGGAIGTPATLYLAWVAELASPAQGKDCAWTFFESLLCALRVPNFCPEGGRTTAPLGGADPPGLVLQRYRDEVLSTTQSGQYYAGLYDQLAIGAIRAIVAAPSLAIRILKSEDEWIPALAALVDGQGSTVTVSQTMQDTLLAILQSLEAAGSPALASALAFERDRLNLDGIAGLTMTQFQSQVVTLGGPTGVEKRTWGAMKDLYRPRR